MVLDTQINDNTVTFQSNPVVVALTDGGFLASWSGYQPQMGEDYDDTDIYMQRYDADGLKQGEETRVNIFTDNRQEKPSITTLNDGGFVVTWESLNQDGSGYGIYAQRYDHSGVAQGGEFRVNSITSGTQERPSITTLKNGDFVVTWTWDFYNLDGNNEGIYMQRYMANGVKQGDNFLVSDPKSLVIPKNPASDSAITALNDGGFVVTWTYIEKDGSREGIYAQIFNSEGVKQGSEFRVNDYTDNAQYGSSVAALTGGGFVVSWSSRYQDGSGYGIYAQRYDSSGVASGSEFRVNTYTESYQINSSVTSLTDGGFVVSWSSLAEDGSGWGIYAQRYDSSGVAQGEEFRVNSDTSFNQEYPSITTLKNGDFVEIWETGSGQWGEGLIIGIYGKRFNANGNEIQWVNPSTLSYPDRLFNWAESIFSELFPNHPESQEILGYFARIYENGKALGEQNDNIYFYDGISIALVGTVNDFLPDAIAAGF